MQLSPAVFELDSIRDQLIATVNGHAVFSEPSMSSYTSNINDKDGFLVRQCAGVAAEKI